MDSLNNGISGNLFNKENVENSSFQPRRSSRKRTRCNYEADLPSKIDTSYDLTLGHKTKLEKTIKVYSSSKIPKPKQERITNPTTHKVEGYVEFKRKKGRAVLKIPESWKALEGKSIIYEIVSSDGRRYTGRTDDVAQRMGNYLSYFNGDSDASHRPLAQAWKDKQRLFVGIKYICSSNASSRQNETSFIIQGKTLYKDGAGFNGNKGDGDAHIVFGSPLHGETESHIPDRLIHKPLDCSQMTVISDLGSHSPSVDVELQYNSDKDSYFLDESDIPDQWGSMQDVIYRWKVEDNRGKAPSVRKLYGKSIVPMKRFKRYVDDFNGSSKTSHLPLPQTIKNSGGLQNMTVKLGIVCCVESKGIDPPTKELSFLEGFFISHHDTTNSDLGFNKRKEKGSLSEITFPAYDPMLIHEEELTDEEASSDWESDIAA